MNRFQVILLLLIAARMAAADAIAGQAIYKEQCARCHGAVGEGTKKRAQPLVGEKSPAQLAKIIERTMPDDDPGTCTADDAKQVAAYIHDAFYSPDARARLNPPRIELSHLTVAQYRNSVADVIGSFRAGGKTDGRIGLRGEYFNGRNFQNQSRFIDRIDPEIRFDFGTAGPVGAEPGKMFTPHQFGIRWEGSVRAPETGNYEFVVRTEHALRLWVNDAKRPLIDGSVKSGSDVEYRASIFLLSGRSYTLKLEFAKGSQRGQDKRKGEPPLVKASISLAWKPPHRPEEVIPARLLSPWLSPELAVVQTPFPPDDRSYGWERGTSVSREWEAATTEGALEVAEYVADHLAELSGVSDDAADRAAKLRAFCRKFAERAFRRPLSEAERQLVDRQFDAASEPGFAVKRVVLLVMKSPRFLFPGIMDGSDAYAAATRLAYTLWDSPPDQALLDAAAAGKLASRDQLAQQAQRLLNDPRARAKVRQFLLAWLKVDQAPELVKDAKRFPEFDAAVAADLRTSLELFLDDVVWSDASDFRQLFLSDEYFINGRLGALYGAELPADAGFTRIKLSGERAGVLTHPYMLSVLAYAGESSPIHRGVFVGRGLLGITLRPPPEAFTPLPPELHPDLTTRQRITLQTKPAACISCHGIINPLGFTLENFDAVGRHRQKENGKAIDVAGEYETRAGETVKFTGPRQLAAFLAGSEEAQAAFSQQLFHHLVKQPVRAYGLGMPAELSRTFAQGGYSVRKLMVEIAVISAQNTSHQ